MWAINELEDPYSDFVPYRSRGRICLQWDSGVNHFCHLIYNESWQNLSIDVLSKRTDDFVKHFSSEWAETLPKLGVN